MKRKVALAFVAAVLLLGAAALAALRSAWAGERLCALVEARVRAATGEELELAGCRVEPFRLAVRTGRIRVGSAAAPLFTAEAVRARLAPVQPLGRRVELAELEVRRPRLTVKVPASSAGGAPAVCPPPALERFGVHRLTVEEGAAELRLAGGERVVVERFDVRAAPVEGRRGLAALAPRGAARAGLDVAVAGARLEAGSRTVRLDEAHLRADVTLDLSRADVHLASVELPGASAAATGAVVDLCSPRLDLAASARGDVAKLLAMAGVSWAGSGAVAADLAVTGPAAHAVVAGGVKLERVVLDGWRAGDAEAQVRLAGPELRVAKLTVNGEAGGGLVARGTVHFGRPVALEAEGQLDRAELGEIFSRLQLPGAWVMARVSGKLRAAGTVAPLALSGEVGLDVADFRVLGHGWETWRPREATFLDLPRARVDGEVRVDGDGVRILSSRVKGAGPGTVRTRGLLAFDGRRGFDLAVEGDADLGELRHVGPVPIAGRARLDDVTVRAAPYGNPHVAGRARVQALRFLELDLGEATAAFTYDDFLLRLRGVDGLRGATRWRGEAAVELDRDPVRVREASYEARGRLRDLFEAAMPWQPDAVYARDAFDGEVVVRGTAHGPAPALDARFEGELGPGRLLERAFDGGRFAGRVEEGARAAFERAELRRGSGAVRGRGRVAFDAPHAWHMDATADALALADLDLPGAGWEGRASGTAAVTGSYAVPVVHFSGRAEGVAAGGVSVGWVDLGGTLRGERLEVEATADGVRASVTAGTAGAAPFALRAELDQPDVTRWLPGGPPAGLRAAVRGSATAEGSLRAPEATRGELVLASLRGGYGEFKVDAAGPVVLALREGQLTLRPVELRGANTAFTLAGTRDAAGALALDARGTLDLRLLTGLLPGVAEPRGQLAVEAHVAGTLAEPLLVGAGQLRDAGFKVRELPVVFTALSGELAFSQDRMLFDALPATVNGARAELSGEVELVRLFPARVRVGAELQEVPVRIPEWLPTTLSGRLQAEGTWDAMLLSGKLHVVRARYTDPVDLEKRVVEVRRRRPPERPFDKAGEWLGFDIALAVDGDARIENDLVRGSLRGDLTLTGTLASVGLVGTLTMAEGSRATFRGNDFRLTHAVVDFTDRRKVRMSLDVHGDAPVRDYQVFMHVSGPYEDPLLQLTSQPALSQQDLVTLLSLGWVSRDVTTASGVSGVAAAAAAQALVSASGLDEQVRRFVPRGSLLRDFSLRITSAYSEGAGQVEPRAEFESKVLDDRFRLRYQAPLTGARGQRAQAEMQLGPRTSLQYQWDNDSPDVSSGGDHGLDLKLRWEWSDP